MASTLSFSFELFPPRTPEGVAKLPNIIGQLAAVRPNYFSVTHGAGGSDQDGTYETVMSVVEHAGVEAVPHLTCVGSTRAHVAALLQRYCDAGIKRIVGGVVKNLLDTQIRISIGPAQQQIVAGSADLPR